MDQQVLGKDHGGVSGGLDVLDGVLRAILMLGSILLGFAGAGMCLFGACTRLVGIPAGRHSFVAR
jgi:hypothetical protein